MTTTDRINRVIAGLRLFLVLVGLAIAALGAIALLWVAWRIFRSH
jgi:hypothetical protein